MVDYDVVRAELKHVFVEKVDEVRSAIAKLQKAQRAAEQALDMYEFYHSLDIGAHAFTARFFLGMKICALRKTWHARVMEFSTQVVFAAGGCHRFGVRSKPIFIL